LIAAQRQLALAATVLQQHCTTTTTVLQQQLYYHSKQIMTHGEENPTDISNNKPNCLCSGAVILNTF